MRGVSWNETNQRWRASYLGYLGEFISYDAACECRVAAEIKKCGRPHDQKEIEIRDNVAHVPIYNQKGFVVAWALADVADAPALGESRWCKITSGYAVARRRGGKFVFMHRFLVPEGEEVDHIDRNKMNNQRDNLRSCTRQENGRNLPMKKNNKSGYKGVRRHESGKWEARLMFNRKHVYLGRFNTAEEAAIAYDAGAKAIYEAFAATNKMLERL